MSIKIKTGLSQVFNNIQQGNSNFGIDSYGFLMGKVYGVITTPNTPTKEAYEEGGGADNIGLIFYKEYTGQEIKDKDDKTDWKECGKALPLFPNISDYPLINEIVYLIPGPSPDSQDLNKKSQMYYVCAVNLWNSNQANNPSGEKLGKTYSPSSDIRRLLSFEGDRIYQGRKGNGIRFGTTVKYHSDLNEWSNAGNDGDPITILTNGYITSTGSLSLNVEEINKEMSSIYMTSTQLIPLLPDRKDILNPITKPILPDKYNNGSQIILNSDRVTLNSKKNEVMIFAKTNVEISTNNIINLNAESSIHLNTKKYIYLGTTKQGKKPTEPLLLGNQTVNLLTEILKVLGDIGVAMKQTITPPLGGPVPTLNTAGTKVTTEIERLQKKLKNIISSHTFTI